MKFLQGKLDNPSTPLNIRLFIAKLIINTEEVLPQHFHNSGFIGMLFMCLSPIKGIRTIQSDHLKY